jgi:hypothetical protein
MPCLYCAKPVVVDRPDGEGRMLHCGGAAISAAERRGWPFKARGVAAAADKAADMAE